MKTLHIMLIALCWVTQALAAPGQVASVNYTVIDQDGTPVPNADITAWIWTGPRLFGRGESVRRTYVTDQGGHFQFRERVKIDAGFTVKKQGYYDTTHLLHIGKWEKDGGTWPPRDAKDSIVLKKVSDPIPMKVKRVDREIPNLDQPVSYDLVLGDWCTPYGTGLHSDIVFSVNYEWTDHYHSRLNMTALFPDAKAGLLPFHPDYFNQHFYGSALRSCHVAPATGYTNRHTVTKSRDVNSRRKDSRTSDTTRPDRHFYLRIAPRDAEEAALYGKIYSDIDCRFRTKDETNLTMRVRFLYYLNTNHSQNVECDIESVYVTRDDSGESYKKYPWHPANP